ncbi:response regulator [Streptomyces sp. NPDC001262]|uniref:response regulator n=1 Tax=Streptomyces TaxID=1883 RepID=UPI00159B2EEB|nr:LuxR family DNA-binding response regulator [Streptomyces sp.]
MSGGCAGTLTRIVVVDDHTLFREGLREILEAEKEFVVVGEAGSHADAVRVAGETQPDVALLDVGLPDSGAAETVRRILDVAPATRVIMVSVYDEPRTVQELLACGVRGYLLKSVGRQDLLSAVRSVLADDERIVLSVSRASMAQVHAVSAPAGLLSAREREVMTLVAQGMTNGQAASRLSITEGTVKHHLRNIFGKLGATSRLDAVNKAISASLIDPRDQVPRSGRG